MTAESAGAIEAPHCELVNTNGDQLFAHAKTITYLFSGRASWGMLREAILARPDGPCRTRVRQA
jgi:hypothetical protein